MLLTNDDSDPIRAGDITVFKIEGRDIPIVHRVIKVHEKSNEETKFLTKGDNNQVMICNGSLKNFCIGNFILI